MLDEGSEQALDGEVLDAAEPGCNELVPLAEQLRRPPKLTTVRADANFLTHLIATAEQAPQTRMLRRGSLTDAQTAYGAGQDQRDGVGCRTRHTI